MSFFDSNAQNNVAAAAAGGGSGVSLEPAIMRKTMAILAFDQMVPTAALRDHGAFGGGGEFAVSLDEMDRRVQEVVRSCTKAAAEYLTDVAARF